MAVALSLAERGLGRTGNNPSVGCVIVKDGRISGRGWTQPGGRPHAEAMALLQAGDATFESTIYVSLEPCAHQSERGPACTDLLIAAAPRQIIATIEDIDLRTAGNGFERLRKAGIEVITGVLAAEAEQVINGFRSRIERGRPFITLKLATSLDGAIAMADGSSRWITGAPARAHGHIERARCDAILVGAGTYQADSPLLDVRLPGLHDRSPRRIMLGRSTSPQGWETIADPSEVAMLDCNNLLIEGGAMTATSFLKAGLVDRLLLYRAPILIGGGKSCLGDFGLADLGSAHCQWWLQDARQLGNDRLEVYRKTETA